MREKDKKLPLIVTLNFGQFKFSWKQGFFYSFILLTREQTFLSWTTYLSQQYPFLSLSLSSTLEEDHKRVLHKKKGIYIYHYIHQFIRSISWNPITPNKEIESQTVPTLINTNIFIHLRSARSCQFIGQIFLGFSAPVWNGIFFFFFIF